jgi:hypothetical protein
MTMEAGRTMAVASCGVPAGGSEVQPARRRTATTDRIMST